MARYVLVELIRNTLIHLRLVSEDEMDLVQLICLDETIFHNFSTAFESEKLRKSKRIGKVVAVVTEPKLLRSWMRVMNAYLNMVRSMLTEGKRADVAEWIGEHGMNCFLSLPYEAKAMFSYRVRSKAGSPNLH